MIAELEKECVECGICSVECGFLRDYGSPKSICQQFENGTLASEAPFNCALCGLCQTVCPKNLAPASAFLEMRRILQQQKRAPKHHGLRIYEALGSSLLFASEYIPPNCHTVFFPGCALATHLPGAVKQAYRSLQGQIDNLGIVFECCHKPSHDLGRDADFHHHFDELCCELQNRGVKNIITACPSCQRIWENYGDDFNVRLLYHDLPQQQLNGSEKYTLQDPCVMRQDFKTQQLVRQTIPYQFREKKHHGEKTLCCGVGAGIATISPKREQEWLDQQTAEIEADETIISYCAGCSQSLGRRHKTVHLLELLFPPEKKKSGYLQRFLLSHGMTFWQKKNVTKLLLALVLLTCAITIHGSSLAENPAELLQLLPQLPAPLYLLIMTLVPVLFLPAFPFVMLAGVLYGPVWGTLYALLGSSLGAMLAFTISRYLGANWSRRLGRATLGETQQLQLQKLMVKNGWKMVIILRLIPLFPFTPLNYALGLSSVSLRQYGVATIIGITPACTLFVAFSGSLQNILQGDLSALFWLLPTFLILSGIGALYTRRLKRASLHSPKQCTSSGNF